MTQPANPQPNLAPSRRPTKAPAVADPIARRLASVRLPEVTLLSEADRLAALYRFSILDSLPQQEFNDIAEVASLMSGTPIGQVSFIDSDRQWIKASAGIAAQESPRAYSFCAHTIQTGEPLVVPDATADVRFVDNPLVQGQPFIRSYAGAPIVDEDGAVLGTVCAIGTAPQAFSSRQIAGLQALARQVLALLEQRRELISQEQAANDARAHTESVLQATVERLHLAQEAGRIATWEWDLATDLFRWSGDAGCVYGRNSSELRTLAEVLRALHPEDVPRMMGAVKQALEGRGDYRAEFRTMWPDGTVHWAQAFGKPVMSLGGTPVAVVGLDMDVTGRKLAEEAVVQNEKLAVVGRLASSIAHEINNPLESVTNLIYLARLTEDVVTAKEYLGIADTELRRVSEIANQTLRFHKQATRPQEVQFADLVKGVLAVQHGRIRSAPVQVEAQVRPHPPVLCFEGEIRQVVNNLIGNAVDAMQPLGGRLVVRARETHEWVGGRRPGVALTIADTGPGISPAHLRKIFEAFFTTKGIGGTGLGLWVSKEILERHHGRLSVRSSQHPHHHGTVFTLFLPFEAAVREEQRTHREEV